MNLLLRINRGENDGYIVSISDRLGGIYSPHRSLSLPSECYTKPNDPAEEVVAMVMERTAQGRWRKKQASWYQIL